jgi:hypothetical protein
VREYLLDKWGRTCAYCGITNVPLEVEHIIPKSRGGTDRVSNLTLSCKSCNRNKGDMTAEEFGHPTIQDRAKTSLKAPASLNNIRWRIVESLNAEHTYGYITKYHQNKLGLEKSHVNDAFVIAGGTMQERCQPYDVIQVRRRNRALQVNRKGFTSSIRTQNYTLHSHDLVKYENRTYRVKDVHCYGTRVVLEDSKENTKSVAINKVELISYGRGLLFSFR